MDHGLIPEKIQSLINQRRLLEVVRLSVDIDLYSGMRNPISPAELSVNTGLDQHFIEYLLDALLHFGFVEQSGGLYRNTPESGQYLDSGSPAYLGRQMFSDFEISDLLHGYVKGGPVTPVIDKGHWSPDRIKSIASVSLLGGVQSTLACVDLSRCERLLDVGGGHGLYSIFFTRKYPGLNACIVELPQVAEVAQEYVKKFGAESRVKVFAADYHDFKPHEPYDVVFLSNVAGSAGEMDVLLGLSMGFLRSGGALVLRSFVVDARTDEWSYITVLERYTRRGKKGFTSGQLVDAMKKSGFRDVSILNKSDGVAILRGIK